VYSVFSCARHDDMLILLKLKSSYVVDSDSFLIVG
jgi:hypothetical protein